MLIFDIFEPWLLYYYLYKINFKISFRKTTILPNGLVPDQDRRFVGPDMSLNCLRKLSADDKSRC